MRRITLHIQVLIGLTLLSQVVRAELRLPHIFSEHMVLQRERSIPIWGWATEGANVEARLGDTTVKAVADKEGVWRLRFPARSHGGPLAFTVKSDKDEGTIAFQDVWVGEVWLCSGQSNMEWPVSMSAEPEKTIENADHSQIRLFMVPKKASTEPQSDCEAIWNICSPQSVAGFSAVGYHFALKIADETGLPVGMIGSYWGGTRGEAWVSRESLKDRPFFLPLLNYQAPPESPHNAACSLFNGMLAPVAPYAIRGALWYQGESNIGRAEQYARLLPALIADWRFHWAQGDFPFYYAQLAPYSYGGQDPTGYAELCDAQRVTLSVPNTGMAVTNDIGNLKDIHPADKKSVGERLALWALCKDYGNPEVVPSGPLYRSCSMDGGEARIHFDHTAGGLKTRDDKPPTDFQIAGKDRRFQAADARIEGETVIVSSPNVPAPVAVRFAWHESAQPNLMNAKNLPASAFRTDDFKLNSEGGWNP